VIFKWDPAKAAANARKHGVDSREAASVLEDRASLGCSTARLLLDSEPPAARWEDDLIAVVGWHVTLDQLKSALKKGELSLDETRAL